MIGIIPKPTKKILPWQDILFYISMGLLTMVILSYLTLIFFENKTSVFLRELKEEIAKAGTAEERALEAKVSTSDKQIKDFAVLLSEYQKSSNFFKALEESTHPRVWISKLDLQVDNRKAVLSGRTPNFKNLEQQLIIFQSRPDFFEDVNLSDLSLGKEGEVEFTVDLSLSPKLFK